MKTMILLLFEAPGKCVQMTLFLFSQMSQKLTETVTPPER